MRVAIAGASGTVGRYVVDAAQRRGHDPVALTRSHGVDVSTGEGLSTAVVGCDVVIDVANAGSMEEGPASEFFTAAAGNLQRAAAEQGVGHVVTLSIAEIDQVPFGYFGAKLAHERAAAAGSVASTIQRATQFHEFPAQALSMTRDGGQASVFHVRVQTVAARSVAEALLDAAEGSPQGRVPDLVGPEPANLVDLARAFVTHRGERIQVQADTSSMAEVPRDALLPGNDARIAGPTFEQWLDSKDAATLAL